ncbi:GNAT family N-acetyltransferase [Sphingomonas sp. AR_OL41]|jgi:GNAT superfamily N-acetyltransferase|uniref:GNAT family N-acetyltransferase n=1 Tax=Sphingomonas sp. AR_OL41 TaxID=3042729 RepID=UPI002481504C|nr:GNAT family N-acetyltransferase [Sphingomonas sp. AR_OL41]MDH7975804.1 GNAT family N-acetyltransferase [Sphingomonas sp. AR_OL41]
MTRDLASRHAQAGYTIAGVATADDVAVVRLLFQAYADGLGIDLGYQDFADELATLPGKYAVPHGALLLARDTAATPLGCAALRPLGDVGEMKRLYVTREARGMGLGAAMIGAIVGAARRIGYRAVRLDTLPDMAAAQALYAAAGFRPIAPYYGGAPPGTLFLELVLS